MLKGTDGEAGGTSHVRNLDLYHKALRTIKLIRSVRYSFSVLHNHSGCRMESRLGEGSNFVVLISII